MYFCELNRTRPRTDTMDGIFWSMNPQVHAFDDVSLVETPEAQGEQVRAARASCAGGAALFVGPVTLRRRYNVNATVAEEEASGELPDSVDPRQASLLGAVWTLASAKHLAEAGADSVTYYETTGWRGVMQGDEPPPLPELFPGRPGQVFPLYHVLADVCELRGAEVLACTASRPLEVAALAAERDGDTTILLANLTVQPRAVALSGIDGDATLRRLDEESAEQAAFSPAAFRSTAAHVAAAGLQLELAPFETVRIDI
jgi:hypothetical protein